LRLGRSLVQLLGRSHQLDPFGLLDGDVTPRQTKIAQAMYDETGPDGRRAHTVAAIAAEFGVSRPTIYRHLQPPGRLT